MYAFRGADIRNIIEFEKAFPDTSVVVLDQNYRSTQTILDAANSVISNNFGRKPKDLWTNKSTGDKIVLYRADDEVEEAAWVVGELQRQHEQSLPSRQRSLLNALRFDLTRIQIAQSIARRCQQPTVTAEQCVFASQSQPINNSTQSQPIAHNEAQLHKKAGSGSSGHHGQC